MSILETLANINLLGIDPNGGVLTHTSFWRPKPSDPNPEQPGEKVTISGYLPTNAKDLCPCASGKHFGDCCQPLPFWRPVSPNPGMQGYSLLAWQSATFTNISPDDVYDLLQEDIRVHCTEDIKRRAFWLYWGEPALQTPYGILCFGDIELKKNRTLLMTALSDLRMQTLLDLLSPLNLGTPQIEREPPIRVRKLPRGKRQRKR